jgi:hypothetical protein
MATLRAGGRLGGLATPWGFATAIADRGFAGFECGENVGQAETQNLVG